MIYGTKEYNIKDHYYSQENNPEEQEFKKLGMAGWLETCGPTSAINCIASMGHYVEIKCPGRFKPQPESTLADWFNDPRNYQTMSDIRSSTPPEKWMGNRIPQYYPAAAKDVFNVKAAFISLDSNTIIRHLKEGRAVQGCLINPGHYIAILAYDDVSSEFIFNDPWSTRPGNKNGGFNESMAASELAKNLQHWGIVYFK